MIFYDAISRDIGRSLLLKRLHPLTFGTTTTPGSCARALCKGQSHQRTKPSLFASSLTPVLFSSLSKSERLLNRGYCKHGAHLSIICGTLARTSSPKRPRISGLQSHVRVGASCTGVGLRASTLPTYRCRESDRYCHVFFFYQCPHLY